MNRIKLRLDNISHQHQYDLLNKLRASIHPHFNDKIARRMIEDEIEKRKRDGEWDHTDSGQYINYTDESNNCANVPGDTIK